MALFAVLDVNGIKDKLLGERLRLALQELGPVTGSEFGQMLSTRRDLFRRKSPSARFAPG